MAVSKEIRDVAAPQVVAAVEALQLAVAAATRCQRPSNLDYQAGPVALRFYDTLASTRVWLK